MIETRALCLLDGEYQIALTSLESERVWTIASSTNPVRITVHEQANCDGVRPDDSNVAAASTKRQLLRSELSVMRQLQGTREYNEIVYRVPDYECMVRVMWSSPVSESAAAKQQSVHEVLVAIALGVGDKKALVFSTPDQCAERAGTWDWYRWECSVTAKARR